MDPLAQAQLDAAHAPPAGAAAAVVYHIFQTIFTAINTPLTGAVNGIEGSVITWILTWSLPALSAYLAVWTACYMLAPNGSFPLSMLIRHMLRFGVAMMVIGSTGAYNQWVAGPLQGLPNELGNAITGSVGGQAVGGAAFDNVYNHSYALGESVMLALPGGFSIIAFVDAGVVMLFWIVMTIAVLVMFVMWAASFFLLSLLIAVGPLAIITMAFPQTRAWGNGWLSAALGCVTAQILIVALLALIFGIEKTTIDQMTAQADTTGIGGQIAGLLAVGALLGACAYLSKDIPRVASSISHGAYQDLNAYAAAAGGAVQATGRAAMKVVRATA